MTHILLLVGYFLIAILVKSYYKLHRWTDKIMPEEPYFVGLGWPIYFVYRLIAWPYISGSRFIENKMLEFRKEKEATKVRVSVDTHDRELEEAEQEIESMLSKERSL